MSDELSARAAQAHELSAPTGQAHESDDDYAALVRGLLDDLAGTSITRLEFAHGDLRVSLRRAPGAVAPAVIAEHATAASAQPERARPAHWHAVEAPLTGLYYARPAPDEEPFVHVGSHVDADSVVGLIEAMKMFNQVTADVTGTVREVVAGNGELIEAGQPIIYVEPGEGAAPPVIGAA